MTDETAKQGGSPLKWGLVGCCGCLVILVAGLAGLSAIVAIATEAAFQAAHEHVALVQQGKVEEAYAAGAPELKQAIDLEGFRDFVRQWPVLYAPGADLTVTQRRVLNDQAVIAGTTRGPDGVGGEASVQFQLKKIGDAWRVAGINLSAGEGGDPGDASAAQEAAEAHVTQIQAGELDAAYAATSAAFRAATDRQAFGAFVEQFPALYGPGAALSNLTRRTDGDQGQVSGTTRGADGTEADVTVLLKREEGEWRISGVNVVTAGETAPAASPAGE